MAHFRSPTSVRQTRDSARLVTLAQALARSGSRVEDRYWEHQIEQVLTRLLRTGNDAPLEAALTRLAEESDGYEILVEQAETLSESATLEHAGCRYATASSTPPWQARRSPCWKSIRRAWT